MQKRIPVVWWCRLARFVRNVLPTLAKRLRELITPVQSTRFSYELNSNRAGHCPYRAKQKKRTSQPEWFGARKRKTRAGSGAHECDEYYTDGRGRSPAVSIRYANGEKTFLDKSPRAVIRLLRGRGGRREGFAENRRCSKSETSRVSRWHVSAVKEKKKRTVVYTSFM